jgi:hypothetical protein
VYRRTRARGEVGSEVISFNKRFGCYECLVRWCNWLVPTKDFDNNIDMFKLKLLQSYGGVIYGVES